MSSYPVNQTINFLKRQIKQRHLPIKLFLLMCANLAMASAVYANTSGQISQGQAYAIALLALATLAVSIYLFFVIFIPEKF